MEIFLVTDDAVFNYFFSFFVWFAFILSGFFGALSLFEF